MDFIFPDPERHRQCAKRFFCRQKRHGGTFDGRKYTGKIVTSHFADKIVRAKHLRAQQFGHAIAHGIADVVTPNRVDSADHAAIDQQHGQKSSVGQPFLHFAS